MLIALPPRLPSRFTSCAGREACKQNKDQERLEFGGISVSLRVSLHPGLLLPTAASQLLSLPQLDSPLGYYPLQNPVSLNSFIDNSMRLSIQSTPVEKAVHRAQLLLKIRQTNAKTLLPRAVATPELTGIRTSSRPKGFGV
jgi:hypothetical protein